MWKLHPPNLVNVLAVLCFSWINLQSHYRVWHRIIWQQWKATFLPFLNKFWSSTQMFWRFLLADAIISLCKLIFFGISRPNILIMSERDLELIKYKSVMTVIFKGLTWPIFARFWRYCYNSRDEYKLGDGTISNISMF